MRLSRNPREIGDTEIGDTEIGDTDARTPIWAGPPGNLASIRVLRGIRVPARGYPPPNIFAKWNDGWNFECRALGQRHNAVGELVLEYGSPVSSGGVQFLMVDHSCSHSVGCLGRVAHGPRQKLITPRTALLSGVMEL